LSPCAFNPSTASRRRSAAFSRANLVKPAGSDRLSSERTFEAQTGDPTQLAVEVQLSRSALAIGQSSPVEPEAPPLPAETSAGDTGEVTDETTPIEPEAPAPLTETSSDSAEKPSAPSDSRQVPPTTRNLEGNFEAPRGNMDTAPGVEEQRELPHPPPREPPFHFLSLDTFYIWIGLHTGYAWLDSAEANQTHIGQSGATFYGSIGIGLFDLVTLGASAGMISLKDHAPIEEAVVDLYGDGSTMTAKSSVAAFNTSVQLGLRTPSFCLDEAV